jgi:putative ABC transport system ATP-binding protein
MPDTNPLILETRGLCKSYFLDKTPLPVLFDINLKVARGEFTAIMGPSGSGKSTLLNILGCLDIPSSGEYLLNQTPVSSLSPSALADVRNRTIGFVFQNFNLLPKLDVFGNVELPLIYGGVPKRERREKVDAILRELGIWERRKHRPNEISGGQKQRVAIGRALVKRPAIILADEPTGNLDSTTTEEILALLRDLNQKGNTILIITHEREVAAAARNIHHLRDGRLFDA